MKKILPVCLILLYNNAFTTSQVLTRFLRHNPPPPNVTERRLSESSGTFTQKLDHFDPDNTQTWSQRFLVNPEFFNKSSNNVAFLMLGGEGEIAESWMTSGSWISHAKQYGAILFQLEHRFYGKSQPFPDLATENLRYLSSQQALADAAEFIKSMNIQYSLGSNVKWIAFGGSYGGSLSAWLRLKYPEVLHAAVSSSGPLEAQVDFTGYFQVVIDDLNNTNEECAENLKKGMAQVDELLVHPVNESVTGIFNLCDLIEQYDVDHVNVKNFYTRIAYHFAGVAQNSVVTGVRLEWLCDILNDKTRGLEIRRIADILRSEDCLGYNYYEDIEYMKLIGNVGGTDRQWTYQTCTEFGWYQTTNREDKVFGRGTPVEFYTQMCIDVFGDEFDSTFVYNQIEKTRGYYHGTDINATRIVFTHGSFDPWQAAGILEANNPDSPVIYIEGTTHCTDMYQNSFGDPYAVMEARAEIGRIIGVWLSE